MGIRDRFLSLHLSPKMGRARNKNAENFLATFAFKFTFGVIEMFPFSRFKWRKERAANNPKMRRRLRFRDERGFYP